MVSGRSDIIDIAGYVRHETDAAILLFDGEREVWLPKSKIEDNGDGTWGMPEWLAMEKELI